MAGEAGGGEGWGGEAGASGWEGAAARRGEGTWERQEEAGTGAGAQILHQCLGWPPSRGPLACSPHPHLSCLFRFSSH